MTLAFMLDTNAVSYALRGQGQVAARLRSHSPSSLCVSAITVAELRYGADKRGSARLHALIDAFVGGVSVQAFGSLEAAQYGKLSAALAAAGTPIGQFDTLIAAHALTLELILITSNTRHFSAVPGLGIDDWFQ
ncbi:MAG: PIN domain-containing protein [Deltaproteobacteria bacterium]